MHDLSEKTPHSIVILHTPFVTGYGGIFRRSHSRGYYKAAEEIGYSSLRPQQELAVKQFVSGNDVFVCLPTGSGKSLCYSVLPSVFDHLSVLHIYSDT